MPSRFPAVASVANMAASIDPAATDKSLPVQHLLCKGVSRLGHGFDEFIPEGEVVFDVSATISIKKPMDKVHIDEASAGGRRNNTETVAKREQTAIIKPLKATKTPLRAFVAKKITGIQAHFGICLWVVRTVPDPAVQSPSCLVWTSIPSRRGVHCFTSFRDLSYEILHITLAGRIWMSGPSSNGARSRCSRPLSAWRRRSRRPRPTTGGSWPACTSGCTPQITCSSFRRGLFSHCRSGNDWFSNVSLLVSCAECGEPRSRSHTTTAIHIFRQLTLWAVRTTSAMVNERCLTP